MTSDAGEALSRSERQELERLRDERRRAEIEEVAKKAAHAEFQSLRQELDALREEMHQRPDPDEEDPDEDEEEAPAGRGEEEDPDPGEPATPQSDEAPRRVHLLHRRIGGR